MIPNGNRSFPCGFNPRTPCGVRLPLWPKDSISRLFQSTHSLWSATRQRNRRKRLCGVSIHALLVECDRIHRANQRDAERFNPRTPCGVRRVLDCARYLFLWFQSTHSLWSATFAKWIVSPEILVSIHALLVECDGTAKRTSKRQKKFQSTHSLWSATVLASLCRLLPNVSIHALLVECDSLPPLQLFLLSLMFQSTHSLWSATAPDLIHCYSTEQIILCANLPKKTVIARLLFLSIYLSIFYSQCITPIADLPGNSCELEVGAQAMFNSL